MRTTYKEGASSRKAGHSPDVQLNNNATGVRSNMETTEKKVDNTKIFKKIVRDHNAKTGFNFVLPKDTNYADKYAHPVHDDGVIKITSQMDEENNHIYALQVTIGTTNFRVDEEVTYQTLKDAMQTDEFKYRAGTLRQLQDLYKELGDVITLMTYNILDNALTDIQKEENYDLAVRTAKALYRTKD